MIVAKFSTLGGGCWIEQRDETAYQADTRCFRFDEQGRASFALYGDLTSSNPAPRWYGHCYKETDFVLA